MLRFRHRTGGGVVEATAESPAELDGYDLVIPVDPPEVWMRITGGDGAELFAGETSTSRMRRSFPELVEWLLRDNPVPDGSILFTGTGLVPPDDFTLEPGHRVDITVPGIGTLTNPVVSASELVTRTRSAAHV